MPNVQLLPNVQLYCDTVENILPHLDSASADGVLCDPPYGIDLDAWDAHVPLKAVWDELFRIMKPGANLMAFAYPRMHHRAATLIEGSGLTITDELMWLRTGFPRQSSVARSIDNEKLNPRDRRGFKDGRRACGKWPLSPIRGEKYKPRTRASKPWIAYNPALKPGYELVILSRKPLDGTLAHNALKWGVGGLNVGNCRVGEEELGNRYHRGHELISKSQEGRFPANLILDEDVATLLDNGNAAKPSRFYYHPRVSPQERTAGLTTGTNDHPSLKPISLTQWLANLILPPKRATTPRRLLVPFCGTFSEIIGAIRAGWDEVIGIEMSEHYCDIGKQRLQYWCKLA
jgi:site-specific DNA-methyltransferase (adenine-specific)